MNSKKVAIVGAGDIGWRAAIEAHLLKHGIEATVIEAEQLPDFDFEVGGVKYIERISNPNPYSRQMEAMKSMLRDVELTYSMGSTYQRKRPSVNIVEEFKLIQAKKSKLSRSDRDWVVRQFNRLYSPIQ